MDANAPPGPPPGDGLQAAIEDIQAGAGPGHGAAGAEGAPLEQKVEELSRANSELKEEVSELKKIVEQFSTSAALEILQLKQEVATLREDNSWWHKRHNWQPDETGEC